MKKIMIDIDDVITNQDGYLYLVNHFLNTNYTINDVEGYFIQDLVPEHLKKDFINYFITQNTYDYCDIQEDCVKVIEALNKKYEVYICSSYVFRDHVLYSADALKYKFEFLVKNFPFLNPNQFMFATNKTLLDCEIKIDDKMDNLENAEVKLLYTAYHNKEISDEKLKSNNIVRVNNWKEIKDYLL